VNTIRLRLLKIGARIPFTTRRVVVSMASGYPWQGVFAQAWKALRICAPTLLLKTQDFRSAAPRMRLNSAAT